MEPHTPPSRFERVPTLFVTGAPGAGKTALVHEISEQLWEIHEPHAVIDIDELCRGVLPKRTTDFNRALAAENLAAVWKNFYSSGVRRFVLARILQSADDLALIQATVPEAAIVVCRLEVSPSLLADRISHRESGSAAGFLTRASAELAPIIASLDFVEITVRNGPGRSITDLATEVLQLIDWPRPVS